MISTDCLLSRKIHRLGISPRLIWVDAPKLPANRDVVKLPPGFDPSAVTEISLNACAFSDTNYEKAEARAAEFFPNAELKWYLHHEDLKMVVLQVEPRPGGDAKEQWKVFQAVRLLLWQGDYSGKIPRKPATSHPAE